MSTNTHFPQHNSRITVKHVSLDNFVTRRFLTDNGRQLFPNATLTEQDRFDILSILGKRCKESTKRDIIKALRFPSELPGNSLWRKLQYTPDYGWDFCAGQSYTDEVRMVRDALVKAVR